MRSTTLLTLLVLASCASPPWRHADHDREPFVDAVVYFALPGRDLSDKMTATSLPDADVRAALREGGLRSYRLDGFAHAERYRRWVGSGEGMGVVVFDARGEVLGARPGPQDPAELAAYLRLAIHLRPAIAAARAELAAAPSPAAQVRLGALLLELGARRETERLLNAAADAGEPEAAQLLARLHALEGRLDAARERLASCPPSPGAAVTLGYLLYKERRHAEAVATLAAALVGELGPERVRARLFFGKALHESGRDAEAIPVLEALIADAAGTTFAGAAAHTLSHIRNPDHGHTH